jgi:hypothetical protein
MLLLGKFKGNAQNYAKTQWELRLKVLGDN